MLAAMARSKRSAASRPVEYVGEVWTDARGRATVTLPDGARTPARGLHYELRASAPRIGARVVAELMEGRFTIETDEPHVRVAWRARVRVTGGKRGKETQ
jgi:hypothetical protein